MNNQFTIIFCGLIVHWILLVQGYPENSYNFKKEGDLCTTTDGSLGQCSKKNQCEEQLSHHRQRICGNERRTKMICCSIKSLNKIGEISRKKCEEYKKFAVSTSTPMTTPKNEQRLPHMVALGWHSWNNRIKFSCSGTLISENFVLTAAHCVSLNKPTPFLLRVTDQSIQMKTENLATDVKIVEIFIHPEFKNNSINNDIALLRMDRSITFNQFRRPACLWVNQQINTTAGIISGWGSTQLGGKKSNDLLKSDVNILINEQCSNLKITDTQLCAKTNRDDICQESGGPLQVKFSNDETETHYIVGITSIGMSCGSNLNIYTRVSSYIEWIESIVWK